jgi:hypothetical protein
LYTIDYAIDYPIDFYYLAPHVLMIVIAGLTRNPLGFGAIFLGIAARGPQRQGGR